MDKSTAFHEQRGLMYRTVHSMTVAALVTLFGCAVSGGGTPDSDQELPFDVLISGARVIDGTGNPWFRADVGIRGDVIAEIGSLSDRDATRTIEARDRIVSPGFIDMMGQSSLVLITDPPSAESKLRQGITTYLSGEGGSPAPHRRSLEVVLAGVCERRVAHCRKAAVAAPALRPPGRQSQRHGRGRAGAGEWRDRGSLDHRVRHAVVGS